LSFIPLLTARSMFVATGGTIYTQGGFTYHLFTETGSFSILSGSRELQFIAVGGGGAGGRALSTSGSNYSYGGGGGGGGVSQNSYAAGVLSSISINIGSGGSVSNWPSGGPSNGGQTQVIASMGGTPFPILTANGGGYGADTFGGINANSGASGGGAGIKVISGAQTNYAAGAGDGVTGFNGGTVITGFTGGGGGHGGGSASAGGSGPTAGGLGITAYNTWFNDGTSSLGPGGNGGRLIADFPITNYGNGGNGGATTGGSTYAPSSGRDGVVVIRYAV
jgi:hypothetical protein